MILGAKPIPRSGEPWSADPADYPACKFWARFYERPLANETALVDYIGTVTTLAVVANGTGDPDATSRGLTLATSAGNEVYAASATGIATALRTPGSGPIILEADLDLTSGDHTGAIIEVGDPFTVINGYSLNWNSSGYLQFRARGATGAGFINFTTTTNVAGARAHVAAVWNRSAADTLGSVSIYVNGALAETGVLDIDPGVITCITAARLSVGSRTANVLLNLDAVIYNARVWIMASLPANIAEAVLQMSRNTDELPPLLAGVA